MGLEARNRINEDYKNPEWLRRVYVIEEYSRKEIGGMCGVDENTIRYYMKKYGITSRTGPDRATSRLRQRWSDVRRGKSTWNAGRAGNYDKWSRSGEQAPGYKGGTAENKGYIKILSPEHPYRDSNGYVFEHRLVCEELLGRYLTTDEIVHHRDGNPKNNAPDNLFIFYGNAVHFSFHRAKKRQPNLTEEEFCRGEDY